MKSFFTKLAVITVLMVIIAGMGAYLISKTLINQSKVDAVSSAAKGISSALSEQVNLYSHLLGKMAEDPDVISAASQKDAKLLAETEKKLAHHFPDIILIKIIIGDNGKPANISMPDLSFADLEMVTQTFNKTQLPAIQGEGNERHLAITQQIMQDNHIIAVIFAALKYDFINAAVTTAPLEKGYLELRQDKLVLASAGKDHKGDAMDNPPIPVNQTNWQVYFDNSGMTNFVEFSLIFCIILIPALLAALSFVTGYRKFSELLRSDLSWVIKANKDLLTDRPATEYPIKIDEVGTVVTTLVQFKRALTDKNLDL